MVLSKRERIVAIAAVGALVVLVLDHYALNPLLDADSLVQSQLVTAKAKKQQDANLLSLAAGSVSKKWNDMVAGGLKSNPTQAEGAVLQALAGWASQAGLPPLSMTPEHIAQNGELGEITVQVAGTGTMATVSNFLWRLSSSQMPVRIKDVTILARREGADDLSMNMHVSTLYLGAPPAKAPSSPAPTKPAEEEQ